MREDMHICPVCGSQLNPGILRCNICGAIIDNIHPVNNAGGNFIYNDEPTQEFGELNQMFGENPNGPQRPNQMAGGIPNQMAGGIPNQMAGGMPNQMPGQVPPQNQPEQNNQKPKSKKGLYIGLTIAAIVLIAAIIIVLVVLMNKDDKDDSSDKRNNKTTGEEAPEEETSTDDNKGVSFGEETTTAAENTEERPSDSGSSDAVIDYSQTYMASYDGFEIEIPEYWSDRVTIEEKDINSHFGSVIFYQTASHKSGDGVIAYICWYIEGDEGYTVLPSYKELGTGNGKQYIICYPTDVQYDYEDEEISQEYTNLSSGLYVIEDSFTVTESSEEMQFVFPDSDSAYISSDSLANCTDLELRIAKNELYARRGRIFETEPFVTYFSKLSWYNGYITADDFDESVFNDYEIANRDAIVAELSRRGLK